MILLVVTLEAPTVYFDSLVAFITYAPLNQEIIEKYKDEYALEPDKWYIQDLLKW